MPDVMLLWPCESFLPRSVFHCFYCFFDQGLFIIPFTVRSTLKFGIPAKVTCLKAAFKMAE